MTLSCRLLCFRVPEIKPHFKRNIYFRLEEAELLLANLWQSQDLSLVLSLIHPQIFVCPAPRPLCLYTCLICLDEEFHGDRVLFYVSW